MLLNLRATGKVSYLHILHSANMLTVISILLVCLTLLRQVNASPVPDNNGLFHRQSDDKTGAVASESDICSKIGIDVLARGGNAADAHVATTFCIGVVAMYHSGVGGGGFMIVRASNGSYEFIDFRETAPAAATKNMFTANPDLSIFGGLARYSFSS